MKPSFSRSLSSNESPYSRFEEINGQHDLRSAAPGSYVDYRVRLREGAEVFFFNFELAKEMGLIPQDHPHELNAELTRTLIETFGIVIINEYDLQKGISFKSDEVKPYAYMATRYLQLQHPGKKGTTSGDGRGIWNGQFKSRGVTWDVSSSGTGATRLSPAVAIEKKFFRTGDPRVCYGSGYNCVDDGLSAAVMSEVFHRNGVPTERTLAILSYPGGSSINVRAAKNLLRPSHFFAPMKQGNYEQLKGMVDYYIEREKLNRGPQKYWKFAERMAEVFAEMVARFENEYIFCWLDWDGDNILTDGGIIDYGSVRQFGMFHGEYRYEDTDRYSTKLSEQKKKAQYIVQTFIQIADFLSTGKRRKINRFKNHALIQHYKKTFETKMDELLLKRVGFSATEIEELILSRPVIVRRFREHFAHFERLQSVRGIYEINDGVTSDAVFCMRDLLREYPRALLAQGFKPIGAEKFIELAKSSYAKKKDLSINSKKRARVRDFEKLYRLLLVASVGGAKDSSALNVLLRRVIMRSSVVNRADRITGDGVLGVTQKLLKAAKSHPQSQIQKLIESFVKTQILKPIQKGEEPKRVHPKLRVLLTELLAEVVESREGL